MPVRDIIIAALLIACVPPCLFRPFWGVLMWIIVGLVNPHTFMWQMAYDFPWAVAVAVPTLVGFVIFSRGWTRLVSPQTILIAVLWCWFTFTTIQNTGTAEFAHFAPETWFRWGFVSKVLLMAVIMTGIVDTWERFRTLILVICGCLGFFVVKALPFMILTGGVFRLYGPRGSMLADNNDLGLALNMTLPLFFFMSRTDPNPLVRKAMMFLFFATIPAIFFTYSRGALLGFAAVMICILMRMRQRLLVVPILLLAGLFAVFFTPERWQQRMDFRREGALIDNSALSRLNAWTYCWRLAQEYPLTGAGFEAFTPPLFAKYAPNPQDVHGSHSIYFGVLAEHGFIGLALYLTVMVSTYLSLRRVVKDARYAEDEALENYAKML
jgi:putative inorganic carbon (HCO3(-)) transporter